MKGKERIKDLAYFFAGYSLLGIGIMLVLMLGFNVGLSEIVSLAIHGERYLNVSCLYMLVSLILFPIATIVHIFLTMKLYYRGGIDDYPIIVAFFMELTYVFRTLCLKPYKGLDLRWLFDFPRESANDRKIDISRWFPRFVETALWWGIIAAVIYTILTPGNNGIILKIKQVPRLHLVIILGLSLAVFIIASIVFGLLESLFDSIRVRNLNRVINKRSKRHYREVSKPVGCTACGGPYPLCKDGCPLFDD